MELGLNFCFTQSGTPAKHSRSLRGRALVSFSLHLSNLGNSFSLFPTVLLAKFTNTIALTYGLLLAPLTSSLAHLCLHLSVAKKSLFSSKFFLTGSNCHGWPTTGLCNWANLFWGKQLKSGNRSASRANNPKNSSRLAQKKDELQRQKFSRKKHFFTPRRKRNWPQAAEHNKHARTHEHEKRTRERRHAGKPRSTNFSGLVFGATTTTTFFLVLQQKARALERDGCVL